MRRFIKLGALCSFFLTSFFVVGLITTQEVHATHITDPHPQLDACPPLITWNPPAGTTIQMITVYQGTNTMCFDHTLNGSANSFPCSYPGKKAFPPPVVVKLTWVNGGMVQTEYKVCK